MSKFERAPENSPNRCQSPSKGVGQCPFMAMKHPTTGEYMKHCPRHGARLVSNEHKAEKSIYRSNAWSQRIRQMERHPQSKSLTAELGVLRVLLEEKLAQYTTPGELMMASGSISDLVVKIEKLVRSVHHLDLASGAYMDKEQVSHLANTFVNIVCNLIEDPDILEEIITQVQKALDDASGPNIQRNTAPSPQTDGLKKL